MSANGLRGWQATSISPSGVNIHATRAAAHAARKAEVAMARQGGAPNARARTHPAEAAGGAPLVVFCSACATALPVSGFAAAAAVPASAAPVPAASSAPAPAPASSSAPPPAAEPAAAPAPARAPAEEIFIGEDEDSDEEVEFDF